MNATAVATRTVEVLRFEPESSRAKVWLESLGHAGRVEGLAVASSHRFRGGSDLLLLWGPGAPNRFEPMAKQVAAGGHVLALDIGYWDRLEKVRISIDAAHPQRWVMRRALSDSRVNADRIYVGDHWNPDGPIIIAGLGKKAKEQYGADVIDRWERAMFDACRVRWPNRPVLYRRKLKIYDLPSWSTGATSDAEIERVLPGASLLITWHSNVAVDAIRLGIPVVCRDGAAAAVCYSEPPEASEPLPVAVRAQFLANLAWYQWAPSEAAQMWRFVAEVLQ